MPTPLFPFFGKAGSTGAIPAILVPAQPLPPAPDAIVDDDDGSSWAFLQQATLAVVLAASVATVARAAQAQQLANSWQDELPTGGYGAVFGTPPDLWAVASTTPRFVSFGADEVIVPQPALDDGSDAPLAFVVPARITLDVAQSTDDIVPQSITVDEIYWQAPEPVRPVLAFPAPVFDDDLPIAPLPNYGSTGGTPPDLWAAASNAPRIIQLYADEVIVPQPAGSIAVDDGDYQPALQAVPPANVWVPVPWQFGGTEGSVWGPIDEDYALDLTPPRRALPCLGDAWADEAVVAQPVPLHIEEVYWEAPPAFVTVVRSAVVFTDNPEMVPQPVPFRLKEGTWEPPFTVPAVRSLHVSQLQDEVVPTIHIDEMAVDPWLLIPARRIIVLPPDPDDWPGLFGVMPEIMSARLECFPVFSASLDTLPTFTAAIDIEPEPE